MEPENPKDAPAPEPAASEGDSTLARLEAEVARLADLEARARDAHLRAEADLQNVRRRAGKESEEAERRGETRAFSAFLALLDDLARALAASEQAGEPDGPLVAGVRLVLARAQDELTRLGVTRIDPVGQAFDPREHEALLSAPSDAHPTGHVAQVVSPGYRQGERLLRPARVIVSHGPAGEAEAESQADGEGGA